MTQKRQNLNTYWRVFATGFSFLLFGLGSLIIGLFFLLIITPLPITAYRKQCWVRQIINKTCQAYIVIIKSLQVLSFSIEKNDIENHSGHLIIANHPTLLDAIFVLSAIDNVCCIVKADLWKNPLTYAVVTLAGYIPNTSANLVELATNKLRNNENILIFPEGTRNTYNSQLEFKRGAANIAVLANCPILPIIINCTPRTLQKHEKWYQVPTSTPHFSLRILPVINIANYIDTSRPRTIQYRHLTGFLREYYRTHLST
ncbi:1-acyl-sn-glycerol-3-phosphate acyltransferase [Gammaproteobacteria bacterium AH-315-M22]|nr:1-acyl-sn-glycerol-3-phosphate acyltransferase [Gammaproteobacteria bacterium AH-315-M22]